MITQEEKKKLLKQQHFWYSQTYVLFEILKQLKNRELALLNNKQESHLATRFLYASSLNYLIQHLRELGVSQGIKLINLYHSNAIFQENSIPVSSYNLKVRTNEEQYILFNQQFSDKAKGFDFIIDIDTKTIQKAYEIAKELKSLFDERKLPYYLKFSGTRGFHFIINDYYLPQEELFEKIGKIRKILLNLTEIYDLNNEEGESAIDISVTNLKGLIKLAYSFDSGNIALPLSDEQFENFHIEDMKIENVLRKIKIMNRGLLIRKWNFSDEQLKDNTKKFFEEFDF